MKDKRKVKLITAGRDAANGTLFVKKIGRNDPCPCGSGKKAKNCCGTEKEYSYYKAKLKVTPESKCKKKWPYPFEVGEAVKASAAFPTEAARGMELIVLERGIEEHIGTFYFKVAAVSDPEHLIDTSLWYADGHLAKTEEA